MIFLLTCPIYLIDIIYTERIRLFRAVRFFIFKSSVIVGSVFAGRYRPFYQSSNIRKPSVTTRNSLDVTVRKITCYLLLTNVRFFKLLERIITLWIYKINYENCSLISKET